jgi:uncharacterized protein YebE (UPF0316 family)
MGFTEELSVGTIALLIFALRTCDVSLGTLRTISVVNGRLPFSVLLGFFEILLWVTAVSHVILRLREHPVLAVAYAGGFATGNALGILLEKRLAIGRAVVRIISKRGVEVAEAIAPEGHVLGVFRSELNGSPSRLVFVTLARKELASVIERAREIDPELVYVVERFSETSLLTPLPAATGWRAVLKKK